MTAFHTLLYALDGANCSHKRTGENAAEAQCPAHQDRTASLCVGVGEKGVLLKCQAGCETADVVAALGLRMSDLFDEPNSNGNGHREIVATYQYVDESGKLLYEVVRFAPKDFRQRRPDGSGGGVWKLGNTRRVLYRLPAAIEAVSTGKPVYIVEGERDVEALEQSGVVATCNPGGAGKWKPVYNEFFKGARVTIVADKDAPGRKHAAEVAKALAGVAGEVNIVEAVEGKDAADHLAAGHGLGEFVPVADDVWRQASATSSPSATKKPQQQADVADVAHVADPQGGRREAELRPTDELLDRVLAVLRTYVLLPSDAARDALALFTLHTWAIAGSHATPYVLILSAEKQSGKSRLLEVLELLVRRPWPCLSASESALFRKIESEQPTLLLDEVDAIFQSSSESTEGIRGVLNGGNRRGAKASRCVGKGTDMQVVDFAVFCPKALAGISSNRLPETIVDRSIVIHMKRRLPDEKVERLRMRFAEAKVKQLRSELERWAAEHEQALAAAEPGLPEQLSDRQADAWEALFAIADLAGNGWPERARTAAERLQSADESASKGALVLAAIKRELSSSNIISTAEVLLALNGDDELSFGGWNNGAGINARDVAHLLKPYGIKSKNVRVGEKTPKGYAAADLQDAFRRYLSPPPQAPQRHNNTNNNDKQHQQAKSTVAANVADVADNSATPSLGDELAAFYEETSR